MGMGFWVRRSRRGNSRSTQRHGSKESIVARRAHKPSRPLEVRITFEPSHVSPACVVQAYERVVPITRRTTPQALPPRQAECTQPIPQVGRRQES